MAKRKQKKKFEKDVEYDYRVVRVPIGAIPDKSFQTLLNLRSDASWIWNSLVDMHRMARYKQIPYFSMIDLGKQMTGNSVLLGLKLPCQSQNMIFSEFLGVCETTKTNRQKALEAGDPEPWKTHKYPFRQRDSGRDVHYDRKDCKNVNGGITFPLALATNPKKPGKTMRQEALFLPFNRTIPKNTTGITIHYCYSERKFYFLFKIKDKKKSPSAVKKPTKYAAIDLGQIRWAAIMTEDGKSSNMKGKGWRSIVQGYNKKMAFCQRQVDKKVKGSNNRKKAQQKKTKVVRDYQNKKNNYLHNMSRAAINFLKIQKVTHTFVGDCRSLTQKDSGKRQNQANAGWPIGEYYAMLEYKGEEDDLTFSWQNERNSTRECPIEGCHHHNKIKGRVYKCKKCGFKAHRDAVGSHNILSFGMETRQVKRPKLDPESLSIDNQKYRVPVAIQGCSRKSWKRTEPRKVARSGAQCSSDMDIRSMVPGSGFSPPKVILACRRETHQGKDMEQLGPKPMSAKERIAYGYQVLRRNLFFGTHCKPVSKVTRSPGRAIRSRSCANRPL